MERLQKNNIHTVNLLAVCLAFQLSFFKNSDIVFSTVSEIITEVGVSGKSIWFGIIFTFFRIGITALEFFLPIMLVEKMRDVEFPLSIKRELPFYPFYIILFCISVCLMTVISLDFLYGLFPSFVGAVHVLPDGILELFLYFLCVVIIPVFFGEVFFRGVVMQVLLPWGRTFAIFSSALTGAVFAGDFRHFVLYALIGLLSGYFVSHAGSLWLGVFISLCCNSTLFLHDFILTEGIYHASAGPIRVIIAVIFAIGIFSCLKMDDQLTESKLVPISSKEKEKEYSSCLMAPCVVAYYIIVIISL